MTQPFYQTTPLPTNTIVPEQEDHFKPYFMRTYEEMAYAINSKDSNFYPMAISDVAQNIVNMPNFGAFIIAVSGSQSTLPTLIVSACKSSKSAIGSVTILGSEVGTDAWAGNALTITSTATNFQIAHDRAGVTGNFNIRIIGTQ